MEPRHRIQTVEVTCVSVHVVDRFLSVLRITDTFYTAGEDL